MTRICVLSLTDPLFSLFAAADPVSGASAGGELK